MDLSLVNLTCISTRYPLINPLKWASFLGVFVEKEPRIVSLWKT